MNSKIIARPNASPGFWLCSLIPVSYLLNNLRYPKSSNTFFYKLTLFTALGLNIQSVLYFLQVKTNFAKSKLQCTLIMMFPGLVTSTLFFYGLHQTFLVSTFWGILLPLIYHFIYIKTMKVLPQSFTYGEASVVVQGFVLFLINAVLQIPACVRQHPTILSSELQIIMMAGLFCLALTSWLLYIVPFFRRVYIFYPLLGLMVGTIIVFPVTEKPPIVIVFDFIFADLRRVFLLIYYVGLIGLTVSAILWQLKRSCKASTAVRKIFHLIVVCVFIPGLIFQCTLMYISTGIALAALIILEILRILEIPPFIEALNLSTQCFVDEKDAGKVALTPIYLLVGCAAPMWISPNSCTLADTAGENIIPMLSGVLSIGIGDTAASIIGSRFGKHKISNSTTKSFEGTISAMLSQALIVYALYQLGIIKFTSMQLVSTSLAIILSSIIEAFTDQVDNLILPLVFYIISSLTK